MEDIECEGVLGSCPLCNSPQKHYDTWPQSGTHAFTVPYECGTELDYPLGYPSASWGVSCDGKVKRYVMPKISKETLEKFREQFEFKSFYTPGMKLKNGKIK